MTIHNSGHIKPIVQLGAQVLRGIASPVGNVARAPVLTVIADMHATLANTQGVGLAAPQIGEALRILIVASRPTPRYPDAPLMEPTVMINPQFTPLSDDIVKGWEGCLSIPGIRALVPRYRSIAIDFIDTLGSPKSLILDDFVARVFQHEYDHLDGLVYLDRVENNRDIISEQEYGKIVNAAN